MYNKNGHEMPLGFTMALAHNVNAFNAFLLLDDKSQDKIIKQAQEATTKRELQMLVDNIPNQKAEN